jgi:hypothetical protein
VDLLCTALLIIAALAGTGLIARVAYRLTVPARAGQR